MTLAAIPQMEGDAGMDVEITKEEIHTLSQNWQ